MILVGPTTFVEIGQPFLIELQCRTCWTLWDVEVIAGDVGAGLHFTPKCVKCGELWDMRFELDAYWEAQYPAGGGAPEQVLLGVVIKIVQERQVHPGMIRSRMQMLLEDEDE